MFMRKLLITLLFGKGGEEMLAILWAQMIILGKREFKDTPSKLKEQVKEILVDSGLGELAE